MGLSTHVLDTMNGCPAAGMEVALYSTDGDNATLIKRLVLNHDGRTDAPLFDNASLRTGTYRLRFDVAGSPSLPEAVRARLRALAGNRMTQEGELLITARRFRSQERNRQDAIERLSALIQKAAEPPKPRIKTKPSRAAKQRRMDEKRRVGAKKQTRRPVGSGREDG